MQEVRRCGTGRPTAAHTPLLLALTSAVSVGGHIREDSVRSGRQVGREKESPMKHNLIAVLLCLAASVPVVAQKADQRLADSTAVLQTIMSKHDIPEEVLNKAVCVMVYPSVKKVGIGIG